MPNITIATPDTPDAPAAQPTTQSRIPLPDLTDATDIQKQAAYAARAAGEMMAIGVGMGKTIPPNTSATSAATYPQLPKLSLALRIGSLLAHQVQHERHAWPHGTCALDAMEDAAVKVLLPSQREGRSWAEHYWPELNSVQAVNPGTGATKALAWTIADLNNSGWTRERIADWLEGMGR